MKFYLYALILNVLAFDVQMLITIHIKRRPQYFQELPLDFMIAITRSGIQLTKFAKTSDKISRLLFRYLHFHYVPKVLYWVKIPTVAKSFNSWKMPFDDRYQSFFQNVFITNSLDRLFKHGQSANLVIQKHPKMIPLTKCSLVGRRTYSQDRKCSYTRFCSNI